MFWATVPSHTSTLYFLFSPEALFNLLKNSLCSSDWRMSMAMFSSFSSFILPAHRCYWVLLVNFSFQWPHFSSLESPWSSFLYTFYIFIYILYSISHHSFLLFLNKSFFSFFSSFYILIIVSLVSLSAESNIRAPLARVSFLLYIGNPFLFPCMPPNFIFVRNGTC